MQHTAIHCNTLQHTATHCSAQPQTLNTATCIRTLTESTRDCTPLQHCNTLQHTATHRSILQHIAAHGCRPLIPRRVFGRWRRAHGIAAHYNTLQHTATHRNTPQHTATHRNIRPQTLKTATSIRTLMGSTRYWKTTPYRNIPQHTATHRNTPQHTAIFGCRPLKQRREFGRWRGAHCQHVVEILKSQLCAKFTGYNYIADFWQILTNFQHEQRRIRECAERNPQKPAL